MFMSRLEVGKGKEKTPNIVLKPYLVVHQDRFQDLGFEERGDLG
jgi:hypothetical protein